MPISDHKLLPNAQLKFSSFFHGIIFRKKFRRVKTYVCFVGYARSGHSLVASLLNAHPNITISMEIHALNFVKNNYTKLQIFSLILQRDKWFKSINNTWTGYDYSVPSQYQGIHDDITVIGDKKGSGTTKLLSEQPELIELLQNIIGPSINIKIIHITRNPLDNIATMTRRNGLPIDRNIERYFNECKTNAALISCTPKNAIMTLKMEDFIANPELELENLCNFLDVDSNEVYKNSCRNVVYQSPNKSRHKISWSDSDLDEITRQSKQYSFIKDYFPEST
jgi:hypothetical protein